LISIQQLVNFFHNASTLYAETPTHTTCEEITSCTCRVQLQYSELLFKWSQQTTQNYQSGQGFWSAAGTCWHPWAMSSMFNTCLWYSDHLMTQLGLESDIPRHKTLTQTPTLMLKMPEVRSKYAVTRLTMVTANKWFIR